jgi:tetratricopeptide (TPR) repeat protein
MILECFKVLAEESVDDDLWSVYKDVCLQLAFCYRAGFGTAIDDDESHRWLSKSGMPERLDQQLLALRLSTSRGYQPWTQYAILYHEGHILASMDAQYYREQGLLASILATQEREIQDWKSVLSLTHWLVLDKVDTHISMLLSLGYLDNAEKLARETFNEVLFILPPDSLFAIRTRWNLATACVAQDKLAEAEYLAQKALTLGSNTTADLDDKILVRLDLLACIYSLQGKHEKAARLRERALKQAIETLGEDHIQTIKVMWNLRELYFNQGSLSKATSVNERVLQTARKSLGPDHEMTLLAEVGFAQLLWRHRKWFWGYLGPRRDDNAGENLIEKAQILLGEGHPTSLTLMEIIAKKLAMKSRHDEAINLLTRVVEFSAQTAGPNSPRTIYHRKRLEYFKAIRKYYTFFAKLGSIRVGPWVLAFIKKPFWERQGLQHVWGPVFRR